MNNRRKLLVALGASAITAPLASFAQQQSNVWRVGFLALPNRATILDPLFSGAFPLGMRDLGYVEGKNLVIEWRFAKGDTKRFPGLAAELARLNVNVLVAAAHDGALAAQKATSTIPTVMTTALDPIGAGLVKSLARPGGTDRNVAGVVAIMPLDVTRNFIDPLTAN